MTGVIRATGDGASLFNGLAIGLGIEILSGRLDAQKDTPGYQRLLDEFALHHPNFLPKSWLNLKKWLAFYNDSRDMELIFAPVLFRLNQQYTEALDEQILQELTNLVWKNKARIESDYAWYQLTIVDELEVNLLPKIDNLALKERQELLAQLKEILKRFAGGLSRSNVKEFLEQNANALLASLKTQISNDPAAFQRSYNCDDLKEMATALNLSLVENGVVSPSEGRRQIFLQNKEAYWNVLSDVKARFINQGNPKLKMTPYEAFQGKKHVAAPTQEEIESLAQPGILIREEIIDNPARGNCGFYAFAIDLIDKIQEENISNKRVIFNQWIELDPSLHEQYEAICSFDLDNPDPALLDQLQASLRLIVHHGQLVELKKACANPANDYQELIGNATYIKFAEFYHNREVDKHFNEFAASPEISMALGELQLKVISNFEHLTLVPLFLSLMYGKDVDPKSITLETNPTEQSPVIAAMANITQDYFWGAHHDLNFLASIFKVNLHCLQYGSAAYAPVDLPDRYITKINHEGIHWTTSMARARVRPAISFNESGESLFQEPLMDDKPPATASKKKKRAKRSAKEELSTSALKSSSLTSVIDEPLTFTSEGHDIVPKLPPVVEPSPSPTNVEPRKKAVRFYFSPSQLEGQRKHNLELLEQELGQVSKKTNKPDEDIQQLEFLRGAVSRATIAYTEYSESIWFSLFHRHGNTGRVRARTFHERFLDIENSTDAKKNLICFLSNDDNNGNTHPHSFRTMLLQELQTEPKTLQYTSEHFDDMLEELAAALRVNIDTVRPQW
ncbi:hypothetical protein [Legionella maioricensis]|uniref:Dot/Icm T4SS effector n=1 Tax=Legionella maioricensis TaxID=2896528 RepID=A0A9X2IB79_9GAMM|nr:hypothetical protein [Legionella maioricensis]MCL9684694.1 hypothetical protein [Legionella maioricensis]MCL9687722.1 hypothetical protein [Legionella maioricensis]